MDGRGCCCIARYTGGEAYDMSIVNKIMLKFRPIAPKPATCVGYSGSGGSGSENSDKHAKPVRGKRKYVRSTSNSKRFNNSKKKKVSSTGTSSSGGDGLVTLPLLPETPERKDSTSLHDLSFSGKNGKGISTSTSSSSPIWLSFYKQSVSTKGYVTTGKVDQTAAVAITLQPVKVVGSFVKVECVTDTWVDGNGIGCTDVERIMRLDADTCPGFVSDGENRVWWTNKAYGEMSGEDQVMVWVVMKERVAVPVTYPAFTCKVRVTCGKESRSPPLTVPCDVWRMDNGGYAWRLDVKAALSLGQVN